jgi:hypothetical protein
VETDGQTESYPLKIQSRLMSMKNFSIFSGFPRNNALRCVCVVCVSAKCMYLEVCALCVLRVCLSYPRIEIYQMDLGPDRPS